MGDDVPEPGMVQTGTECDTDKVPLHGQKVKLRHLMKTNGW